MRGQRRKPHHGHRTPVADSREIGYDEAGACESRDPALAGLAATRASRRATAAALPRPRTATLAENTSQRSRHPNPKWSATVLGQHDALPNTQRRAVGTSSRGRSKVKRPAAATAALASWSRRAQVAVTASSGARPLPGHQVEPPYHVSTSSTARLLRLSH